MAGMPSGEKRVARGRTHRRARVVLGKANALGRQPVDVGRLEMPLSLDGKIPIAEVVRQDVNDVGSKRCLGRLSRVAPAREDSER